ncbi:MAG: hypothetical protein ACRDRK_17240 [Pseudonocardia sp.]
MGGRSVCAAVDLLTTVEVNGTSEAERTADAAWHEWAAKIWHFVGERIPGLAPDPPPVRVWSQAPSASGLSTSTALILALFDGFVATIPNAPLVSRRLLVEWAYEFEFAICNGGGMDQIAIALGGTTLFQGRATGLPVVIDRTDFPAEWSLIVVDSGTRKSTPEHIRSVRAQHAAGDRVLAEYVERADAASGLVWEALRARRLTALTDAMTAAHRAMRDLQNMSTPLLEHLRALAHTVGLPLKVSGAGGGGALVGVCPEADASRIAESLRVAYRDVQPGVQVIAAGSVASIS